MKYKYKIGDWVKVKNKISLDYDKDNNRVINKEEVNIFGQVCGARKRQLGKLVPPAVPGYYSDPAEYKQPYLDTKEVITVWLVRTGMLNKPIEVLEEDMYKTLLYVNKQLPWLDVFLSDKQKKATSEMMKIEAVYLARDSKGRFTGEYKNPFENEHGN